MEFVKAYDLLLGLSDEIKMMITASLFLEACHPRREEL